MAQTRRATKAVLTGLGILLGTRVLLASGTPSPALNTLTPEEQKAGWRLLFDGQTTKGWRGFKKADFPESRWMVQDGTIKLRPTGTGDSHGGGDIITADTFAEFDLQWEWRIAAGGNSGLKYFVTEERSGPIAHEYQIIDDARHPDAKIGPHRQAGAYYDVLPPSGDKPVRPAGEWNQSRVVVKGNQVEHWLNGQKVLAYELGSPDLKAAIAKSKFKNVDGFGTRISGHILLQDHGDDVAYRNIKILSPPR
jgi:hypothetical protein